jgi:hypothetical protein
MTLKTDEGNVCKIAIVRAQQSGPAMYHCPYAECAEPPRDLRRLKEHYVHVHLGRNWRCLVCDAVLPSLESLNRRHLAIHDAEAVSRTGA